jgi:hypothetical protein
MDMNRSKAVPTFEAAQAAQIHAAEFSRRLINPL